MKNELFSGGSTVSLRKPLSCSVWAARRGSALLVSVHQSLAPKTPVSKFPPFVFPLPENDPMTQRLKDVLPHDNKMRGRLVAMTVKIDNVEMILCRHPVGAKNIRMVVDVYGPQDTAFQDIKMKIAVNGRTGEAEILVDNLPAGLVVKSDDP